MTAVVKITIILLFYLLNYYIWDASSVSQSLNCMDEICYHSNNIIYYYALSVTAGCKYCSGEYTLEG